MDAGLIYANSRIKSLENNLLTMDKMIRMIDSATLDEAVKVLTESNYGGGIVPDNPNKFDSLLESEEDKTVAFIREIMPSKTGMEIFFYRRDYHNLKTLMKAKYLASGDYDKLLLKGGLIDIDALKDAVMNDDYSSLHREMAEALEEIDGAFVSGDRSPRLIDVRLDRAYYNHSIKVASNGARNILTYLKASIDLINISSFIRSRRAQMNNKFFTEGFIEGGELSAEFYEPLYESSDEIALEKFRYTAYKRLAAKAFESKGRALVEFEAETDNFLLDIFRRDKHDMFGIAPVAGYYLAKMTEIKVARTILVCIKNKVDKIEIKQRLRELYA
jgi:V/A-type H+-transporting ATPase subunit C